MRRKEQSVYIALMLFAVVFKLYDTDGNGCLDSTVSLLFASFLCLLIVVASGHEAAYMYVNAVVIHLTKIA